MCMTDAGHAELMNADVTEGTVPAPGHHMRSDGLFADRVCPPAERSASFPPSLPTKPSCAVGSLPPFPILQLS